MAKLIQAGEHLLILPGHGPGRPIVGAWASLARPTRSGLIAQVGVRKMNVSESLMMCRNENVALKPARVFGPGMSVAGER